MRPGTDVGTCFVAPVPGTASGGRGLRRPFPEGGEGAMPEWGILNAALAPSHLKAPGPLDLGCKGGWSEGGSG